MSGESERKGQWEFYTRFLPSIDQTLEIDDILTDNTDGVFRGNILEFKMNISDLNATLFQCIKYLSYMRLNGKSIPANIIIIDLNLKKAWVYQSEDYIKEIEKVYTGGASKNNRGFMASSEPEEIDYKLSNSDGEARILELLKSNNFTKINIDENCIVGWAERFYRENPEATKKDFIGYNNDKIYKKDIGEIRKPTVFNNFINPYTGDTNIKFQYLMDRLNDTIQKKNLGAFYTPKAYVEKAQELLIKAIERVPVNEDGNKYYVIIDRCAGTGNLEEGLPDEILSHCILSTAEYYEYKVLMEKFSCDKILHLIPPTDSENTFNMGRVNGADALSEEYINNPIIKKYIRPKIFNYSF